MQDKLGRWLYGDKSFYLAHSIVGIIIMLSIAAIIRFGAKQPLCIVLELNSYAIIDLSASLLGFQLAGVAILVSLDGNKKLAALKQIDSASMIYKVFVTSISTFLLSIIFMVIYLYCFQEKTNLLCTALGYAAVVAFVLGFVYLTSSIRLLKWFCS